MSVIVNCRSLETTYVPDNDAYRLYLNDIRKYPLLSAEEQFVLLVDAQSQDESVRQKAIDKLVSCNQRFVLSIAKKMSNQSNVLDLVSEGNLGLIEAINRFNLSKTNCFTTYAVFWIRKYMQAYIVSKGNIVTPANSNKISVYVGKIKSEFFIKYERYPMLEEIQEILRDTYGLNIESLSDLESMVSVSIDESYDDGEREKDMTERSSEYNSRTASNNIDEYNNAVDCMKTVNMVLNNLNKREQMVIRRLYGLENGIEESLDTIAEELHITKERVRQLHKSSMEKLRGMRDKLENIA